MYGKDAIKLIQELDMSDGIKPFNEVIFRQVIEEMRTLYAENMKDVQGLMDINSSTHVTLQFRHTVLSRNKRCLLAYLYNRMRRLRSVRWEVGSILPPEVNNNLLSPEVQWFQSYNRLLATYMRTLGENGLNIMHDMVPPKALYVEVRCLMDYGKFELDDGQILNLKKNTYHLLPTSQCEALIRQGILEHISH